MKRFGQFLEFLMSIILFCLLIFGLYKCILGKQYALGVITTSILFCFVFIMCSVDKIKNFRVGGDKLSISVNQKDENDEQTEVI